MFQELSAILQRSIQHYVILSAYSFGNALSSFHLDRTNRFHHDHLLQIRYVTNLN